MSNCIFCSIISRKQRALTIYQDEKVLGFLDIHPIHTGHTLIIPKKHYKTILDIPDDELAYLIQITKKVAGYIKKTLNATGFRITNNNYRPAGQIVPHLHFHIIPSTPEVPFKLKFKRMKVTIKDLEAIAKKIRIN